jgi:hypothetical protein
MKWNVRMKFRIFRVGTSKIILLFVLGLILSCGGSKVLEKESDHPDIGKNKSNTKEPLEMRTRIVGEYIITLSGEVTEDFIYQYFSSQMVEQVRHIHDTLYLIQIKHDPGPDEMVQRYVDKNTILDIQPNYTYKTSPTEKIEVN